MSYGPTSGGIPSGVGIFGRPIPQPRYLQQQSGQNLYGMYGVPRQQSISQQSSQNIYGLYGLPTQGMYAPNQSLIRNSMMLGFSNPFQQLGYGTAPTYNRYVPPPPPPVVQPVAAEPVQEPPPYPITATQAN